MPSECILNIKCSNITDQAKGRLEDSPRVHPPSCHCQQGNRPVYAHTYFGWFELGFGFYFVFVCFFKNSTLLHLFFQGLCLSPNNMFWSSFRVRIPERTLFFLTTAYHSSAWASQHHLTVPLWWSATAFTTINKAAVGGHDYASPRTHELEYFSWIDSQVAALWTHSSCLIYFSF